MRDYPPSRSSSFHLTSSSPRRTLRRSTATVVQHGSALKYPLFALSEPGPSNFQVIEPPVCFSSSPRESAADWSAPDNPGYVHTDHLSHIGLNEFTPPDVRSLLNGTNAMLAERLDERETEDAREDKRGREAERVRKAAAVQALVWAMLSHSLGNRLFSALVSDIQGALVRIFLRGSVSDPGDNWSGYGANLWSLATSWHEPHAGICPISDVVEAASSFAYFASTTEHLLPERSLKILNLLPAAK